MPALLPILSLIWSAATSQIGVLLIVALAAFGYGHHRSSVSCNQREAAAHARAMQIHAEEMARQAKAAEAIAMLDRERAGLANQSANAMQAEIDSLKAELQKKVPSDAKGSGCVIDGDYSRRVQRLDKSGRR